MIRGAGDPQDTDGAGPDAAIPSVPAVRRTELTGERLDASGGFRWDARADGPGIPVAVRIHPSDPDRFPVPAGVRADGREVSEAYELEVRADGVRIAAASPEGVFRARTTLARLADAGPSIACGRILDAPRYAWRGLSLDVVRCFHPVTAVQRVIDICADVKLNVLHLHLTDDEGWRLPVPGWPRLVDAGLPDDPRTAGSYSAADLADLDAYAASRFVTIVPEIDMPAHSAAAIRAYPALGEGRTLHRDDPTVERFIADAIEAAAQAFPRSAYLHIGGDEAFEVPHADHARFMAVAADAVRAAGRRPLGWQECARSSFGAGDLVQYWMDPSEIEHADGRSFTADEVEQIAVVRAAYAAAEGDVARARAAGARIVASPSARTYLDRPFAADSNDPAQTADRSRLGLPAYPETPLRDSLDWEPTDVAGGVPEISVAGVEAAVWCETVHGVRDLETLILPRLAAIAERAWVPAGPVDWADFRARVRAASASWTSRGWSWYRSRELDEG